MDIIWLDQLVGKSLCSLSASEGLELLADVLEKQAKNSVLPSAPFSGDSIQPLQLNPYFSTPFMILSSTCSTTINMQQLSPTKCKVENMKKKAGFHHQWKRNWLRENKREAQHSKFVILLFCPSSSNDTYLLMNRRISYNPTTPHLKDSSNYNTSIK